MKPIIRAENLNRQFLVGKETINALRNVSVTIEEGALTILRGRSGSGKTTLINLLGALDKPTSGNIYFNNIEISKLDESKRDTIRRFDMGFVFQSVALINQMTAYENVDFGLRVTRYNSKERKSRAEKCLELVGMAKRMHHMPHELSGGEQQRVAIARAVAHKPRVIFADEPTAELDTHMGLQIIELFINLIEKEGSTIIMTTHDPNIMDIAKKVYTLEDGEIKD